jgi:hypothetical protein
MPAGGPVSIKAPVEPTIAISESDLLPSSPEVLREPPREMPRPMPREMSSEVSYTPAGLGPRSRIPHFTAVFCGLLFFADRCLETPPVPTEEAMLDASSAATIAVDAAETEAEPAVAMEIEDTPDVAVAPIPDHDEIADAAAVPDAAPDAADAASAPPRPPVLPVLPTATATATVPPKPPPRPPPPVTATPAKKPPPVAPKPPPPKKPR